MVWGMADLEQDYGAETSRFQAFVTETNGEPPQAWKMGAPAARVALFAGVVIVVAILVGVIAWVSLG
jgi:hypothetical protein